MVMTMVTTVNEAIQVVKGGTDIVIAQRAEAGGHRSTFRLGPNGEAPLIGTFALFPQIMDAIPQVPVVTAGGVMDGRGLVAALALGASGVLIGTRFLVAQESGIFPAYQKQDIILNRRGYCHYSLIYRAPCTFNSKPLY
jgi:nitronate monooxygenase